MGVDSGDQRDLSMKQVAPELVSCNSSSQEIIQGPYKSPN